MSPVIETRKLSKWYGQVLALNDVSVAAGTGITGLLGPNGAGKSTFLWLLTGQLKPSQGEVRVYGESPWRNPALFRHVGFCPETDGFYRDLTGAEFVTVLARLSGLDRKKARDRAAEVLEVVSLTEAAGRRVGTYSKGMRQRLKLAQALVHEPRLLILDEPLAGMDPIGRRDVLALVRRLAEDGTDVILASHVLHEVESVTSRILLINRGRILAEGDVHEIRALIDKHPHHVEIASDRPRDLARRLLEADDVVSVTVTPDGSGVVVQTTRPDDFYARLPGVLVEGNFDVRSIASPDDNLAAVFRYLVE
ncbi:MAG TPA: ABC transporter ATP-binding protein [Planctomycetota bacterium]|nr:ABC transporter ATP-binding protein [Planctomycetota bacterium]